MDFGRLWNTTLPPNRLAGTKLRRTLSDSNVTRSVPGNRVSGRVFVEQRSSFFMPEFRGILAAVSEEKSTPCRKLRRTLSDSNVTRSIPGNRVSGRVFVEQRSPFFMPEFRGILAAVSEKSIPCRRVLYRKPELRTPFSAREREFFSNLSSSPFLCPSGRSAPRNVAVLPKGKVTRVKKFACGEAREEEDGDEDGNFMPHELAGRSTTKFSVVEGAGRTLKGRDLFRVRNSIWRKTGFLG